MKVTLVKKLARKKGSVARLEKRLWVLIQKINIDEIHLSEDMLTGCIRYSRLTKDSNLNKLLLVLWLEKDIKDEELEKVFKKVNGYDLFKVIYKSNNQFYSQFIDLVSKTLKVLSKPDETQVFHITDILINGFSTRNKTLKNYLSTIAYFVLLKFNDNEISDWKYKVKTYLINSIKELDFENELKQLPLNTSVTKIEEKVTLILLDNILRNITSIN